MIGAGWRQAAAAGVGLTLGLGAGAIAPTTASAAGSAENDMDNYMKVLGALQARLDSMSTKCVIRLLS